MVDRKQKLARLEDLSKRDLVARLEELRQQDTALSARQNDYLSTSTPIRQQIESLRLELAPYDKEIEAIQNQRRLIGGEMRDILKQLEGIAAIRRHRAEMRTRATFERKAMIALNTTVNTLVGSNSQALSRLGRIIQTAQNDPYFAPLLPRLFEEDLAHYKARSNLNRINLRAGGDGARLIFTGKGEVAVMYHPKNTEKDAADAVFNVVPVPEGLSLNRHVLGFITDLSGEARLRPFVLAEVPFPKREPKPWLRFKTYEQIQRERELAEQKKRGISTIVPLTGLESGLDAILSRITDILTNGHASMDVMGKKKTFPNPR